MGSDRNDLTTGSILKKFIGFVLPIVLINLLQAVYNFVDMMIVGRFSGTEAMSAVSIGGQATHIAFIVCMALGNAVSMFVGRLTGQGESNKVKEYVGSMLSFIFIVGAVISLLIIAFCHPLLDILHTPAESYDQSASYLTIYISATIVVYFYNILLSALRGKGETFVPLLISIVTTVENVILDLVFVAALSMDAAGAAIATVLSQITGLVIIAVFIKKKTDVFDFKPSSFRIQKDKLVPVLKVGFPQIIQFLATNISFMFILYCINTFGVVASAAAGAANKIFTFGVLTGQSCMAGIISTTAQNLPKKNYKRILSYVFYGIALSVVISGLVVLVCQVNPAGVYGIFNDDPRIPEVGTTYLRIYSICFILESGMFCGFGLMTGSGHTTFAMCSSIISAFLVRLTLAFILSQHTSLGFVGIAIAYASAPYVGIAAGLIFGFSGKWKKIKG